MKNEADILTEEERWWGQGPALCYSKVHFHRILELFKLLITIRFRNV